MSRKAVTMLLGCLLALVLLGVDGTASRAEEKKQATARPPSQVVVKTIDKGRVEPLQEMVGTVSFFKVSRVAAEIQGIVQEAVFEEGQKVEKDSPLVVLNSDIIDVDIRAVKASFDQVGVELLQANKNLERITALYKEGSVAEAVYEGPFYKKLQLEKKRSGLLAALDRMLLEKEKKKISAPFGGVILEKKVEKGEWVPAGGTVAVIADDSIVDVEIEVPAPFLSYLKKGRRVNVVSGGMEMTGRYVNFIPRGDVATRSFTIKLRLDNDGSMVEGMEARARIPSGPERESLLVPRDAIVKKFGRDAVFVEVDGKAMMIPVTISGYSGMMAGVEGPGLTEGQQVVVKGNERLFGGETLNIQ